MTKHMKGIFRDKVRETMLSSVLLLAVCVFCVLGLNSVFELKKQCNDKIYLLNNTEPLTGFEADRQQENSRLKEKKADIALWGEKTSVVSSEINTLYDVPTIMVCGRTDLLFPGAPALVRGMKTQCLIGKKTAETLFGSVDVIGLTVRSGGLTFTVAGIIPYIGDVFVYETSYENDAGIDHAVLLCDSFEEKPYALTEYVSVNPANTVLDYDTIIWFLEILVLLTPVLLFISFIREMIGGVIGIFIKKPLLAIAAVGLAVIFSVVLAVVTINFLDYPSEMIPSKWSDFEFWTNLFREKKESLWLMIRQPISPPDYMKFVAIMKAIGFIVSTIALYLILFCCKKFSSQDCPRSIGRSSMFFGRPKKAM
jgi:hypothetical protein